MKYTMRIQSYHRTNAFCLVTSLVLTAWTISAKANVLFRDLASEPGSGLYYNRVPSPRNVLFDQIKQKPKLTFAEARYIPMKPNGAPGVAVFDYDNDGDDDIYVTNGPGEPNSLYSNQTKETGITSFIDVASVALVSAEDMDSNGVCYGDIDNDQDEDLLVLGSGEPSRLFENLGNGTFHYVSNSGVGVGNHYSSSCSMGDVNGDGRLDVVIANTWDTWNNRVAIFEPFKYNDRNSLFINQGNHIFKDVSGSSGINDLAGFPSSVKGSAGITWGIAMVDYDQDGDMDIVTADDQGEVFDATHGGVDRGLIHLFRNDGKGHFQDINVEAKLNKPGAWMGLAFGDINSDGHLDMFVSNLGDYMFTLVPRPFPYDLGSYASRWFLGQPDGTFSDPGVGSLVATPFGWGNVMTDYDNDGDTDIAYLGGLDVGPFFERSNPGVVLTNDGKANFSYDLDALGNPDNHNTLRDVQGVAAGDFNDDGFVDIVSVASADIPPSYPLMNFPKFWGADVDSLAFFFPSFRVTGPGEFAWNGLNPINGSLAVDLNSGDNGNRSVAVKLTGTVELTGKGKANRDGIGAIVSFTPDDGKTVMRPILGGASYASQDSLTAHFGLGQADEGMVEVLWPGGVRNRLYNVKASEHIKIPEIPCGFNIHWKSKDGYEQCVIRALREIIKAGVIDRSQSNRLMLSAFRAYREARETHHRRQNDD